MIVIASLILGMANESAGWLRHRLPEVFFWIFLSTGIASPFLGIGTLVFLWMLPRRRVLVDGSKADPRMKPALILAAATTIVAPAAWTLCSAKSSSWQVGTARGRTGSRTVLLKNQLSIY